MNWDSFHKLFLRCCGITALITNCIMFHLICYKSPKNLGAYKYLMICFSIFEFLYALIDMIILPDLYTVGSAFIIVISAEKTYLPVSVLPIFNVIYWIAYGISIAFIDVNFFFRYLVVTGNKVWTSSKMSKLFVWLLYPILFGIMHAAGSRYFAGPTEESNSYLRDVILNGSGKDVTKMDGMGFFIYSKYNNGTKQVNWLNVVGLIQNSIEISLSCTFMCIFGWNCYKKINELNSKKTKSNQYRSVQKQLFLALVLQTVVPLVLMYIPSGIVILFCVADASNEMFGRILCLAIALYPALDPLPNMFVINNFRNALLDCCRKMLCLKQSAKSGKTKSSESY